MGMSWDIGYSLIAQIWRAFSYGGDRDGLGIRTVPAHLPQCGDKGAVKDFVLSSHHNCE